ncbi:MAG: tRNA pseudouridine(55) synthase TruB [Candidatus Sulfotelmatobacter sp.]
MNGVIIVDKPAGWTSHDVVARMRRILGQRSIGHLGTLDPLATGVLPLVVGNLTRLAQFYTASEKTYEGVIRFGFATNTYDADGDPLGEVRPVTLNPVTLNPVFLKLEQLQQLATGFLGLIEQLPPPFSAKKINGVPAYKLARKQQEVVLSPVQVEIKEFVILSVADDRAQFRARVASGTYMRSVAHEMGQLLGCGAHLESLRRTAVAEFDISQAHTLEEIEDKIRNCHSDLITNCHSARSFPFPQGKGSGVAEPAFPDIITSLFIHPRQLLPHFPCVAADEPTAARIRSGRPVNLPELSRARHVKVFQGQSDLIAIATRVAGTLFHPKIVFVAEQAVAVAKGK